MKVAAQHYPIISCVCAGVTKQGIHPN